MSIHSHLSKNWILKAAASDDIFDHLAEEVKQSSEKCYKDEMIVRLLAQNNIRSKSEAQEYFKPSIKGLNDPMLMKGMQLAVDRIKKAIDNQQNIRVYGDYDVDGTTAVALVYSYLRNFTTHLDYYIPDRFKEGYGISRQSIDDAAEKEFDLIIALDCGIKSVELIDYANEKGIDFIICDHHVPGDVIPKAIAVLNPKQTDCEYPYKDLSGCGIGFKLIQALDRVLGNTLKIEDYIDLTAISIASDIVPMTRENRILTYHGLDIINQKPRPAIQAMMESGAFRKPVKANDLVFRIGPRINAAGRMDRGALAVDMLIDQDLSNAKGLAAELNRNNSNRQHTDRDTFTQALKMIEEDQTFKDKRSTVLFCKDWHKGVIGIVASRLIEIYHRPTVLLTESNGFAVGSARSVPGFSIYEALSRCSDLLVNWGGHQAAAGLTVRMEDVELFTQRFEESVAGHIDPTLLLPSIEYNLEVPFTHLKEDFCRFLEMFSPYGPENLKPVFVTRNIRPVFPPKVVGNNHLQMAIGTSREDYQNAIGFGMGHMIDRISTRDHLDICYTIEPNEFRGKYELSLQLLDIKHSTEAVPA